MGGSGTRGVPLGRGLQQTGQGGRAQRMKPEHVLSAVFDLCGSVQVEFGCFQRVSKEWES